MTKNGREKMRGGYKDVKKHHEESKRSSKDIDHRKERKERDKRKTETESE